jgi:hypothetical protein
MGKTIESVKATLLAWLRVPPEPKPPRGSPDSVRVFRAARNFYRLLVVKWCLAQATVVFGVLIWSWAWSRRALGVSPRSGERSHNA